MTCVLIVEDNLTLLENIAFELGMRNYTVLQAVNGTEALDTLRTVETLPDIIVSDIAMPDMDGYQLLEAVRANQDWEMIPFIFLTAFDSPNAQRIGKDLGVDDYLVKPFDPDDLIVAMQNKIRRTQQIRVNAARELDKTRRDLLTMISHELRTPLTAIYGSSELLSTSLASVSDNMTQELLTLMQSGVRRMNRLVNRILYMVQLESGYLVSRIKEQDEIIDLNEAVRQVLEHYEQEATVPVRIQFTPYAQALNLLSSDEYIALIVDEVVDNAVRFSPPNQTILIKTERGEDERAYLHVIDQGNGINPDLLDELQVYVRDGAPPPSHIGLGYQLVRGLTNLLGATVSIEHGEYNGTHVTISFETVNNT